jgi:hypothetical protein
MRAVCGAIITAGALIGLGLTSLGIGLRYQAAGYTEGVWIRLRALDTPLAYILVLVSVVLGIGLAIAFIGLAFHHERRHWERQHHLHGPGSTSIQHPPPP